MRERTGTHLQFDDTGRRVVWLDAAHSSFRLPRMPSMQCCVEPRCKSVTMHVYCHRHFPRFVSFASQLEALDSTRRFIEIGSSVTQSLLSASSTARLFEAFKAIVLMWDFFTLNYAHLTLRFREVMRSKYVTMSSRHNSIFRLFPTAQREFAMRYAYCLDDGAVEFPPSVSPLNLDLGEAASPSPVAVAASVDNRGDVSVKERREKLVSAGFTVRMRDPETHT